jgi:hypothetical protein
MLRITRARIPLLPDRMSQTASTEIPVGLESGALAFVYEFKVLTLRAEDSR